MNLSMNEQIKASQNEQAADKYFKKYRSQMNDLEAHSTLSRIRPITEHDVFSLGTQLDMFEMYRDMCEEDGTLAQLGKIPNIALDVISATYGTSPITAIASTQPINEEQGIVYFRNVVAQTTRGNITAGDKIMNTTGQSIHPEGFAGDRVSTVVAVGDGTGVSFSTTVIGAPIRTQMTKFYSSDQSIKLIDDGEGNILGNAASGTINYSTGAISLTFNAALANGVEITAVTATDFGAADDIPKIITKFDSRPVSARVFALKDTISLESSYAMRRRFSTIADDMMSEDLVAAINSEIMGTAIAELKQAAIGNTDWPQTAPDGVSYFEHKHTLLDFIVKAESVLLGNAGRGAINVLIAGREAAGVLSTLPGFVKISEGTTVGSHIFGTINGMTVIRVTSSATLASNKILALYRGTTPFDSALVYAPYMPLVVTSAMPTGQNPLVNQRAAAVWAAVDTLVPQFVTSITLV